MTDTKQRISSAIRAARKAKGLSQQQVSEMVGTTLETISKAERGASVPSVKVLFALARVLELDVVALIDADDRTGVSLKRQRLEAEVTNIARMLNENDLKLFADFGALLSSHNADNRSDQPED